MEDKNIEALIRVVENLQKQVEKLSKKIEDQEKESLAYRSEEYHKKLEKFIKDSTWNLFKRGFVIIDEKSRNLIRFDPGLMGYNFKIIKLPEPDQK